jgi:UDP-N-acetylmuramoylalanine--D-glutamate ligase
MKIAILGYAREGRSAYDYWHSDTNQITICDQDDSVSLPDGVQRRLGSEYLLDLDKFDLIVRTAGLNPKEIVKANSEAILSKVTSATNEFFRVCPTRNIIGVTGTKGKGTTSTLTAKMLEAAGKKVHLGGNIGLSALDLLGSGIQPDDWVVLELSSFQLIDIKYSPLIGVCLMVVPEHLNWHDDFNDYLKAKSQLFAHQTANDKAIYFAGNDNSKQVASVGQGQKIPYLGEPGAIVKEGYINIDGQNICAADEIKLPGRHNLQNVCAAVTATWQVTQDIDAFRQVLTSFAGLSHRLELVREIDNVKYYDDSFGTTPETAQVAIEAFPRPKVIILGGSDKGALYSELAKTISADNVRSVVLIGLTAPAIKSTLQEVGYTSFIDGGAYMRQIVDTARQAAKPGDVVLLSTACASFDMFKNYEDRGNQFKAAVQALV